MPKTLKDDDSVNRIGGLVRLTIQKVQRIHKLEFLYADFLLSLCYRFWGFYMNYTSTKKSPKKLFYVNAESKEGRQFAQ